VGVDTNILCAGVRVRWGAPKGVLVLAATGVFKLVVVRPVHEEVERILAAYPTELRDYQRLLTICRAEVGPELTPEQIAACAHLLPHLRHTNDLPVLAAALQAQPDWFLSDNPAHFGPDLAAASGLNISTSGDFLRRLIVPHS
jgi:hypothetical protein